MVGFGGSGVSSQRTRSVHVYTQARHADRAISSASQSFIPPTDPAATLANGDELMTVNDAARFLRVTVSWVYEHTRDDAEEPPAVREDR
jgi:hypothetical protein